MSLVVITLLWGVDAADKIVQMDIPLDMMPHHSDKEYEQKRYQIVAEWMKQGRKPTRQADLNAYRNLGDDEAVVSGHIKDPNVAHNTAVLAARVRERAVAEAVAALAHERAVQPVAQDGEFQCYQYTLPDMQQGSFHTAEATRTVRPEGKPSLYFTTHVPKFVGEFVEEIGQDSSRRQRGYRFKRETHGITDVYLNDDGTTCFIRH